MLKIAAIVSLMLIAIWSQADSKRHKKEATPSDDPTGSTLWAASLSCDSCGSECASACGTRHFRSCCFNYLRRKRVDTVKFYNPNHGMKVESQSKTKIPMVLEDSIPEHWFANLISGDYKPYYLEDTAENHLYDM